MHRLIQEIVARPRAVVTAVLLLTALAGAGVVHLQVDNSVDRILLHDDPDRAYLEGVRDIFGADEVLVAALEAPDVFAPDSLARIARLTDEIAAIPGVYEVQSLTNTDVVWADGQDVHVAPVVTGDADDPATLDVARRRALRDPILRNNLVTHDGRATAIVMYIESRPEDPRFRERIVDAISDRLAAIGPNGHYLSGYPLVHVLLNRATQQDLGRLLPASLLLIALLLWLHYRTLWSVALALGTGLLSVLCTIGLLGWSGHSLSIVTAALPPMLLAIGATYAVRTLSAIIDSPPGVPALIETLDHTGSTVLLCGLSTLAGLASLSFNRVEVVREFAIFGAVGVGTATLLSLTLVPAMATLTDLNGTPSARQRLAARRWRRVLLWFDSVSGAHARLVAVAAALIAAGAVSGVLTLRVETDLLTWFPEESDVRRASDLIDQRFSGATPFNIVVDAAAPGALLDPATLTEIRKLETDLEEDTRIGKVLSVTDYIERLHAAFADSPADPMPPSRRLAAQYVELLRMGSNPWFLDRYLDSDLRRANLVGRTPVSSSTHALALFEEMQEELSARTRATGLSLNLTGTSFLRFKTSAEFTRGLMRNLALATALITVLLIIGLRSLRFGLLALVPNLLPLVWLYGTMGWLGMTLNAATVITGCVAIGNAVDATIHYLFAYRHARSTMGAADSRRHAFFTAGKAMIVSDATLMVGFAVLWLSGFYPVKSLGILVSGAMAYCLAADLFLLPALLKMLDERKGALEGWLSQRHQAVGRGQRCSAV